MDRVVVCEESLIWNEGMPVVVGDEPMAAGFFAFVEEKCGNLQKSKIGVEFSKQMK